MSKRMILIATSLIVSGCLLFLGVMITLEWDFTKLSTDQFESNRYEIRGPFTNIRIVTDAAHIAVLPAEDRVTAVDCYELTKAKHTVSIKDGTLTIEIEDTRKWYEHIGVHVTKSKVSVYLPSGVYSDLEIKGSTGNVEIAPDFRFNNMDISVSTGSVTNRASVVGVMDIRTNTGDICVEKVTAAEMNLSVTTGDVYLDGCDAAAIEITTDTGDVSGSLLSEKVFVTHTDTGNVDVPQTLTGGTCEITTDTGDISISIQ